MRRQNLIVAAVVTILVAGSASLLLDTWRVIEAPPLPLRSMLVAAGILFAARRMGKLLNRGPIEEDIAVGFLVFAVFPIVWNLFAPISAAPFSSGVLILIGTSLIPPWPYRGDAKNIRSRIGELTRPLVILGFIGLIWALLSTLAPPTGMDALTYHLGLPSQYLARETLAPPYEIAYYGYPHAGEIFAMCSLVLDPTGIASNILFGFSFVLLAVAAARLGGVIAFACVASMPLCAILVAHTKTDILAATFFILALRRAMAGNTLRCGLLLGTALASKLTVIYGALPLIGYVLWQQRKRPVTWFVFLISTALYPSYFLIRNFIFFGHCLPRSVTTALSEQALLEPSSWFMPPVRLFATTFLFVSQGIDGPYGPLAAVLGAMAVLRKNPPGFIFLAALVLWAATGGGSHGYARDGLARFLLPAAIAGIIGGAPLLASLAHRKILSFSITVAVLVSLVVSIVILEKAQSFLSYLTGRISIEQYMAPWVTAFELQRQADALLPPKAKVLSVGESRLFYLRRNATFDADADLPHVFGISGSPREWIEKENFTHIFYAPEEYDRKVAIGLAPAIETKEQEEWNEYLRTSTKGVLSGDGVTLYEITKSPVPLGGTGL